MAVAAMLAGCVAPSSPPVSRDPFATTESPAPPLLGPDPDLPPREPARCAGNLFQDEQQVTQGGRSAKRFALQTPCHVAFDLEVNALVGSLEVRLSSDGKSVFASERKGVHTPYVLVGKDTNSEETQLLPPGAYEYSWAADAVADFAFAVRAR